MKTMLLATTVALCGCGTMNTARALPSGASAIGVTLGGPLLTEPIPTPLPSLVVEGRVGLPSLAGAANDVRFGTNLTAIAFGQAAVNAGWTWQPLAADGARPSLAVTNQLFVVTNGLDASKPPEARGVWAVYDLELAASWDLGQHYGYVGAAQYLDLGAPDLLLSPFVGVQLGHGRVKVNVESRWFAINQRPVHRDVAWVRPGGLGALGASVGLVIDLGQRQP